MNVNVRPLQLSSASAILQAHAPVHQEEGDITLRMAVEEWHIGPLKARKRLDGIKGLRCIEDVVLHNGKIGRVWRPIQNKRAKRVVTAVKDNSQRGLDT